MSPLKAKWLVGLSSVIVASGLWLAYTHLYPSHTTKVVTVVNTPVTKSKHHSKSGTSQSSHSSSSAQNSKNRKQQATAPTSTTSAQGLIVLRTSSMHEADPAAFVLNYFHLLQADQLSWAYRDMVASWRQKNTLSQFEQNDVPPQGFTIQSSSMTSLGNFTRSVQVTLIQNNQRVQVTVKVVNTNSTGTTPNWRIESPVA